MMLPFDILVGSRSRALFALAMVVGCSRQQSEPPVTPASTTHTTNTTTRETVPPAASAPEAQQNPSYEHGYLGISQGVQTRCNLPDTPREAPQFDYDDIALRNRGRNILDGVVACMLHGSMKNESIAIVGHADPRGTETYNRELGRRRAESARDYLIGQGVPAGRLTVRSRGEQDAQGTDADSWQRDRRVEIEEMSAPRAP